MTEEEERKRDTARTNFRYKNDPKFRDDVKRRNRKYIKTDKGKEILKEQRVRHIEKNPQKYMLRQAQYRARTKGFPCTITESDIVIPLFCPITGYLLVSNLGAGKAQADSPSLDKIVPELGYVPGNVEVVSHRANKIKADATAEELFQLAKHYATDEVKKLAKGWVKELIDTEAAAVPE